MLFVLVPKCESTSLHLLQLHLREQHLHSAKYLFLFVKWIRRELVNNDIFDWTISLTYPLQHFVFNWLDSFSNGKLTKSNDLFTFLSLLHFIWSFHSKWWSEFPWVSVSSLIHVRAQLIYTVLHSPCSNTLYFTLSSGSPCFTWDWLLYMSDYYVPLNSLTKCMREETMEKYRGMQ